MEWYNLKYKKKCNNNRLGTFLINTKVMKSSKARIFMDFRKHNVDYVNNNNSKVARDISFANRNHKKWIMFHWRKRFRNKCFIPTARKNIIIEEQKRKKSFIECETFRWHWKSTLVCYFHHQVAHRLQRTSLAIKSLQLSQLMTTKIVKWINNCEFWKKEMMNSFCACSGWTLFWHRGYDKLQHWWHIIIFFYLQTLDSMLIHIIISICVFVHKHIQLLLLLLSLLRSMSEL